MVSRQCRRTNPSSLGRVPKVGTNVRGSFLHPEGHDSDGGEVSASEVCPVHESPLAPAFPPPPQLIDWGPAYTI